MKDWKAILGSIAPSIATALGGPLAGAATGMAMRALGVTTERELEETLLSASPDQMLALKQADNDFKLAYLKAEVDDKRSARDMQIMALAQEDKFSKRFVYIFAIAWSLAAIGYVSGITFMQIPEANIRFADTTLGFMLGTVISGIVQYFYGSSFGSRMKDERNLR